MTGHFQRAKKTVAYRVLSAFVAFTFSFSYIVPPSSLYAQGVPATVMNLPVPGTPVSLTPGFTPTRIIGMTIHADNPLMFDFMVDPGDAKLNDQQLQAESLKLVKYFLASLTVPAEKLWVNLSPYEKDKIVPQEFGQTEMGAELLAQDYMLKQLTASLMNPEDELGKKFWGRVYAKAQKMFGTTEIPLNTFNKVWIVPEKAVVYANGLNVFVLESRFKVMMEEDYLALQHHSAESPDPMPDTVSGVSSAVIKEVLLPEIEKEVNEGKTFANLRQIHNSLILATWYKQNLKESLLGKIYSDKGKTGGLTVADKETSQKIYNQYVEAFQKGVHNFIKEDYDPATKQIIPRKYFSGGVTEAKLEVEGTESPELGVLQTFAEKSADASIISAGIKSPGSEVSYTMPFGETPPSTKPGSSPVEAVVEPDGERARIIRKHTEAVREKKFSGGLSGQEFLNAVEDAVGKQFENTLTALREAWPIRPDIEFLLYLIQKTKSYAPQALKKLKDLDGVLAVRGLKNIVNKALLRDLIEPTAPHQAAKLLADIETFAASGKVSSQQTVRDFLARGPSSAQPADDAIAVRDNIFQGVVEEVADALNINPQSVTKDISFTEDLKVEDSDKEKIKEALEGRFNIQISDKAADYIFGGTGTVADAYNYVLSELPVQGDMVASSPVAAQEHPPVYYFGIYDPSINSEIPRGDIKMKSLLGGKGAGLADMANQLSLRADSYEAWLRDEKGLSPEKIAKYKLRVPLGYTITTEQTRHWKERRDKGEEGISPELRQVMTEAMARLETASGKKLGGTEGMPLLVAVRSGAKESMPGMMDTVLNLGMNDRSVEALANASSEKFAWDTYRRFVEMYGSIVLGVENDEVKHTGFAAILEHMIKEKGVADEYGLGTQDYKELVGLYKAEIQKQGKEPIPDDPYQQYFKAVETVMRSTFNERAMVYRASQKLKLEDTLSAVNVVEMIYGNRNGKSGTGVAFTRDTATGEKKFNLEFAFEAQGEDVVKGRKKGMFFEDLQTQAPDVAENIRLIGQFLEKTYTDIQDMEFTFEHDENSNTTNVYMLQTRNAKRTSQAEVRAAVEMADEGLIPQETAVKRVNAEKLSELLASRFNPEEKMEAFKTGALLSDGGLNASPGAGVGIIALDADRAKAEDQRIKAIQERIKRGESVSDQERQLAEVGGVVLVREETSPDDLGGMVASKAIATSRGGRTSHAAVVARQFGIPAVVGDKNMVIDFTNRTVTFTRADGSHEILKEGDIISVDGSGDKGKGQVFKGKIGTKPSMIITAQNIESLDKVRTVITLLQGWIDNLIGPNAEILKLEYTQHIRDYVNYVNEYKDKQLTAEENAFYQQYKKLLGWASELRKEKKGLGVGANAERPLDVFNAVINGAERFGLVRTEHMFSGAGRELKFQRMILAETSEARIAALNQLLPQQQADFEQIFLFADGRPVTIRLIDPPLHEFLPKEPAKIQELADSLGLSVTEVLRKIDALKEENQNPMLGTRGVRLSILFPEIIEMQVDAIFNAMKKVQTARIAVNPEIMVPLVGNVREFNFVKSRIENIARRQRVQRGDFKIGTMIEIVAAGVNAAEIAKEAEFLSFGTNDYTQGALKISRDDGKEYLENAKQAGVFTDDPFVTIDSGVALFIKRAVEAARAVKQDIKIGICGEQGVDPTSISRYLAPYGLNYVSGGSLRLPGALLAAAQEALKGHAPLEGKIRKEIPVQKRLYERVPSIADAQTFYDQVIYAVLYVENNGNTIEAKRTALANLDLTREMDSELSMNPDFKVVYSWASDLLRDDNLGKMGVKVKVGADVNLNQELIPYNGLGMMTTEEYFMGDDNPTRRSVQAYLLAKNDARKSEFLSEIKEAVQRNFSANSGDETLTRRTFTVRLPNIALQDVFHYENEAALHAAVWRLSQALGTSEAGVSEGIAKYHELNPAIGQRGSRIFFTEAAPLYATIIAAIAQAAVKKGYSTLNFILPFTVNRKEIEVIRSGYVDNRGKVVVPSIDQILKAGRETIEINIGAEIETPVAAATAADIVKPVDGGPVIIDSKRLTEAVWSAFESDVRGAFLQTYMREGIWEEDPYRTTPADTRLLIQEAIGAIKAKAWNQEINLVVNPNDVKLIAMAQQAGVNNLIVERADAQLATIAAAQAAITIPVLAENGALKAEARKPASSPVAETGEPVNKGGIDLNPGNMDLRTDYGGESIQLPMPNIPLESIKIDGLVPIIIHVSPVVNLPFLLGLSDVPETDDAAEFQPRQSPIDAPRRFKAREAEEIGMLN